MATLDVLDYIVLADVSKGLPIARQTGGWEATAFDVLTSTKWYRLKSKNGWPWDIKLYDGNYVYDWITENGWTTAKSYKKFVQNHLSGGVYVDGLPMFPRILTLNANGRVNSTIVTAGAHTTFRIYNNCVWDGASHNIGDVKQTLSGPSNFNHGGNVGVQPTLTHNYFWNGKGGIYQVREQNLYALNYGWCRWSVANRQADGTYKVTTTSIHNNFTKCTVPAIDFPCF